MALWGGRFEGGTDSLVFAFNQSLGFDRRLWREDIAGSVAHATMLGKQGIITPEEADALVAGLCALRDDLGSGGATLPDDAEDIHSAVEGLLKARIGAVAGKLHTGRSRNDQVATDIRLWLKGAVSELRGAVTELRRGLLSVAEEQFGAILPGRTHHQHAQPVLLSHHLLAYFWMLSRDDGRLADCRKRMDLSPLGAGALAGTPFPLDRAFVAEQLGFAGIVENSLDAVSDRDFAVEFCSCASLLMMHLSRLAEEFVLWSSPEFGFVDLSDAVTTGSSIMPQKKNPDVAELIRGKTGRVYGDLVTLLTLMKGLVLAYNKDMQEDKEPLFDAFDTSLMCVRLMNRLLAGAAWRTERMAEACRGDFSTATDLADSLAAGGVPFREAHEIVGKIVRDCIGRGDMLESLTLTDLRGYDARFTEHALKAVLPEASAAARTSYGGTAPDAVRAQLERAHAALPAD